MLSFLQLRLQGSFDLLCGRDIEPVNSDAPLSERSVGAARSGQSVLRRDQMSAKSSVPSTTTREA